MKSLQRDTRLRYGNPTGELVNILWRKFIAYKRYKRMYPKSRYDVGGI